MSVMLRYRNPRGKTGKSPDVTLNVVVSNSCKAAKLATGTGWLEKNDKTYSYQYDGEFNGDESHCRICTESPTKQIKEHRAGWLEAGLV